MAIKSFQDFRVVNKVRALNLAIQIALAALLFAGLNFVAFRHFYRWDLSSSMANSLSPESVAHIKNLKKPVEIFMTMRPSFGMAETDAAQEAAAVIKDVSRLLSAYNYESGGKISVESVDPILNKKRGGELSARFGSDIENCVVVACGDRFKKLVLSDFYDIEDGARTSFKGEQAVSSAILLVSGAKQNKIYFLQGHGELKPFSIDSSSGLSEFTNALRSRGYKAEALDLSGEKEIPKDADMLAIVAPRSLYLPRELDMIKKYLSNRDGKVLMFLGLGPITGLDDILFDWGMRSDDMLIIDAKESETSSGDMVARTYPQNPHPIVKYLVELALPVQFGPSRPVRQDLGAPIDPALTLNVLIASGAESWAESSYKKAKNASYIESTDLRGPIPIAMVSSRKSAADLGLKIGGGRLAVFGDEDFITNGRFNALGNSMLALNTVNWMFDDNSALNVTPRKVQRYVLVLSKGEMKELAWKFSILPLAVLAAGLFTYILRRR